MDQVRVLSPVKANIINSNSNLKNLQLTEIINDKVIVDDDGLSVENDSKILTNFDNLTEDKLAQIVKVGSHDQIMVNSEPAKISFECSLCSKQFPRKNSYQCHMKRIHFGGKVVKNHKCAFCFKNFERFSILDVHMRIHTGEKPFNCTFCDKSFGTKSNLRTHQPLHTGERAYHCTKCSKKYTNGSSLNKHIKYVHNNHERVKVKCHLCGITLLGQKGFQNHLKRVHTTTEEKSHSCGFCSKCFWNFTELAEHMRQHTGEKPFKCQICSKSFGYLSAKTVHEKRVHPSEDVEKRCTCPICGKKFWSAALVREHQAVHNEARNFKCPTCRAGFKRKNALTYHVRTIHTDQHKKFECFFCGKKISHFSTMNEHLRTHTGERPHSCTICHKTFAAGASLKFHMNRHKRDISYVCTECPSKFGQCGLYSKHLNEIHKKVFNCDKCTKTYNKMSGLQMHFKKNHPKVIKKSHKCHFCPKSFLISQELELHKRTHTGQNTFKCQLCEISFDRLSTLKVHKKSHINQSS